MMTTITCPTRDEWIRFADGETTSNRAHGMKEHLVSCAACKREHDANAILFADLRAHDEADTGAQVTRLVAALGAARPIAPSRGRASWPKLVAGGVAVLAVAAALLLLPRRVGAPTERFTARGGTGRASLRRDVGVTLRTLAPTSAVHEHDALASDAAYSIGYTNLNTQGTAYLMVFVVDHAGTIHWIAPAYLDPKSDPQSVKLDPASSERLLPTSMVLDHPASGSARVIAIVTPAAHRVSEIESAGIAGLNDDTLRARWSDAEVTTMTIDITTPDGSER